MSELFRDRFARVVLLVAVVLRLAFFAEVKVHELDLSGNDVLDPIYLHRNATRIADGDLRLTGQFLGHYDSVREHVYGPERYDRLFGRFTYHDSPGYLYFAALCEKVGGRSPYAVVLVQELLDALGCAFVYVLARRAAGRLAARVALVAAALALECTVEAGFVLRESFLAFLATAGCLALVTARARGTAASWLVAGLVLGFAWVTKLTFAFLILGVPLLAWSGPPGEPAATGRERWTARGRRLGAFALGAALSVAPFAARNVSLGVPPLRMAVTPTYLIVQRNLPGYSGAAEYARHDEVHRILERSDDTVLGAYLETIRAHPRPLVDYPRQLARKLGYFWLAVDFWNNVRCSYLRELSPILRLCVVGWGVLAPWTALGIVLSLADRARRRETLPLVLAFLTLGLATALASGVYTRYRMVVEPVSCVFFAVAVVEVGRLLAGRGRVIGLGLLGLAVAGHLVLRDPSPPLTKRALADYARGTWPSPIARSWLVEQAARSRCPD